MPTLPSDYLTLIQTFAPLFSHSIWGLAQVLVTGAILATGSRTVTAVLRIMGLSAEVHFQNYHRVLNRAVWASLQASGLLLGLLVATFAPTGPVIIGIDDTIERRRGEKIKARGIYRDPVRSSHSHFVKASGLRWLSMLVLVPIPWARHVWALPFLTVLAPSERYYEGKGRRHKKLTAWARQMVLQVRRWLPKRHVVVVADSSFAVLELLDCAWQLANPIAMITRFRLDAALYEPAPTERRPGQMGRTPLKGKRLPTLEQVAENPKTLWKRVTLPDWYGEGHRQVEMVSATAVWYHSGEPLVFIRWVLIRDPLGKFKTQALLCTDPKIKAVQILKWFVRRWQVEIVFPQMTKMRLLAFGASRNDITDFDLIIGDNNPIDKQNYQLPLLLKGGIRQASLNSLAKGFNRNSQTRQFGLAIDMRLQLFLLGFQRQALLVQIAATPLKFGQGNDAVQIGLAQAIKLMVKIDTPLMQLLAAGLQLLWQPMSPMSVLQRLRDKFWMGQHLAQILPNQLVQGVGRNQTRRTSFVSAGLRGGGFTTADVVEILSFSTSGTSQITHSTSHQGAQQVVVSRIVTPRKLLIMPKLGLHLVKNLLANHSWNSRYRDPRLARRRRPAISGPANWMRRRTAVPRRMQLGPPHVHLSSIRHIGQNTTHPRLIPAVQATWRRNPQRLQMSGQASQAGLLIQIPGEHLLDNGRFSFVALNTRWVTRAFWVNPISVGNMSPRQHSPGLQFPLSPAAHPLRNQGPFVFRHRPANLQQQLVMRFLAHGSIQKLNRAARRFQFFQQYHLMHIVSRQPIWGRNQHPIQLASPRFIPQTVQARPIKCGPTIAIIAEDILIRQSPTRFPNPGSQPFELLLARLCQCLPLRRNSNVHCYSHWSPPAWGEKFGSIAEGVGRLDPSDVVHRGGVSVAGALANDVSWSPPQGIFSLGGYAVLPSSVLRRRRGCRDQLSVRCPKRLRQNLSFVISPLN